MFRINGFEYGEKGFMSFIIETMGSAKRFFFRHSRQREGLTRESQPSTRRGREYPRNQFPGYPSCQVFPEPMPRRSLQRTCPIRRSKRKFRRPLSRHNEIHRFPQTDPRTGMEQNQKPLILISHIGTAILVEEEGPEAGERQ